MQVKNETASNPNNNNIDFGKTIKQELIKCAIVSIFNNNEIEEKEQEPDILAEMENFLNEPYQEQQEKEQQESSPLLDLVSTMLLKGIFNYIEQEYI